MNKYPTPLQIRDKGCSLIPVKAQALQSMEIVGLMSLGLFLGMTHAMDADHIAAVSAMWNRQGGKQAWIDSAWALLGRWPCHCRLSLRKALFLAICFRR